METITQREGVRELDTVMSNFDHEINAEVGEELRKKANAFAQYSGWDFCGYVWWDNQAETYRCEVWCYNSLAEVVSGSLEEIMEEVSDRYGYD